MAIVGQGEFLDPRLPVFRLRRFDLWKLCDYYKISYDNSRDTAQSLVRKILDSGVDANQHIRKVKFNGVDTLMVDLPAPDQIKDMETRIEKSIGLQRGPGLKRGTNEKMIAKTGETVAKQVEKPVGKVIKPKKVYASYEEMKGFELRSLCKQRGIPWTMTEKKVSLIEKLNAYNDHKVMSGQNTEKL